MAGAGSDGNASNAISACVAGSASKRLAGMAAAGAGAAAGRDGGGAEVFSEYGNGGADGGEVAVAGVNPGVCGSTSRGS